MKVEALDWLTIAREVLRSRAIDTLEETELYPQKRIAYQFSARGHELGQVLLAQALTHPSDGVTLYYRSRPLMLGLGMTPVEAFAGPLGAAGSLTQGRDIGVVFHLRSRGRATVLPMAGDVGGQYTPAVGWAEALRYRCDELREPQHQGAIAVAHGGEGSVVTNGFWSALNLATTNRLPVLFFIEDNGYAISVPVRKQVPGGDVAHNLASFSNLLLLSGDGTDPEAASSLICSAVEAVREGRGPVLLRLKVPRLCGHSGQDSQSYRTEEAVAEEVKRDPVASLKRFLLRSSLTEAQWSALEAEIREEVREACDEALRLAAPTPTNILEHRFCSVESLLPEPPAAENPAAGANRINMGEAIRRTLASALREDPRVLVFGEDVGAKGGVHAVTLDLQHEFGERRVFDTSLSEEGILGRAVGMALNGLRPIPEIQFRKYIDAAAEQFHNCGTIRWRTAGAFHAPVVVRIAGGFSRRAGDPWHSVSSESELLRALGWRVFVPSCAVDAVGLLRAAIRGADPVVFFEHRALLDASSSRGVYPGDDFVIRPGTGAMRHTGDKLTVVTWGGMVERCLQAVAKTAAEVDLIDLRTLCPWDKMLVLTSVRRTHRLLVVHEEGLTAGFGAEIVATVCSEAFDALDAPVHRLATPDVSIPYHPVLMEAVLPSVEEIAEEIARLTKY